MQVGVNDFMSMSLSKKQKFRKFFTFVATAICMAHSIQTAHCFRFHLCTARYAQRTNSNVCVIDKTRTKVPVFKNVKIFSEYRTVSAPC